MRTFLCLLAVLALFPSSALTAQDSLPPAPFAYKQLEDPELEARATALMHTLRCLTCQSQSIADSDAPLAGDMRHQVRTRILAGESPEAIRTWLVGRYGDYVSYSPQVSTTTWPLFAIPIVILLFGALIMARRFGKIRGFDDAPPENEQ
ncbi:MAG: cytochrome c-type biogenesis protein [Erythrobacter sp.]